MKIKIQYILVAIFLNMNIYAETSLDSLLNILKNNPDSIEAIYNRLAYEFIPDSLEASFYYSKKALRKATKNNNINQIGFANFYIGEYYYYSNKYEKAEEYYNKALRYFSEANNKKEVARTYHSLGIIKYLTGKYDESLKLNEKSLKIRESINDKKGTANSIFNIALLKKRDGFYDEAISLYEKATRIYKELNNDKGIANSYLNIANVYRNTGNYTKTIETYNKALKIYEKTKNITGQANVLNNIGMVYRIWKNYDKSLEYLNNALEKYKADENLRGIAGCLSQIGITYVEKGDTDNAVKCFDKTLKVYMEIGDKQGIASYYMDMGNFYFKLEQYYKAEELYKKSLQLNIELKNKKNQSQTLHNIGLANKVTGRYMQAIDYYNKSLKIAEEIKQVEMIMADNKAISDCYYKMGKYKQALKRIKTYVAYKDSIFNITTKKQIEDLQIKYETEKKEQLIKKQNNELLMKKAENDKKDQQRNFLILFVLLVVITTGLAYAGNKQKRKANEILRIKNEQIKQQKEEIEAQRDLAARQRDLILEQKQELTESIKYAYKIQSAIIPDDDLIASLFSDHFIYYKPRDIVSGDFYWIGQQNQKTIIIAADCTGHGVPGALMSMLGITFLNNIVHAENTTQPNEILNKLRESIIRALQQTGKEEEQKDGMDVAVITIDTINNILSFSGANNPLYMIRNNELVERKGNKMPVAIYRKMENFTSHEIEISQNDNIYIFSDGFADQFGGPHGRKFKYKPFKQLLSTINHKPMSQQKEILENTFAEWKGDYDQIDDVLIIGLKI